jgi:adenosine kinase
MRTPLFVHGTIAFDRIMDFPGLFEENILPDKIHSINVSFYIEHVTEMRGGTGGNIAYNLHLLGLPSTIVTSAGKDAGEYIEYLEEIGLSTDAIEQHDDILNPAASIITDKGNNQITAFSVGAAKRSTGFTVKEHGLEALLILSPANNKPDTMRFVAESKEYGTKYIFDPGQTIPDFTGEELRECIDGALIFTVNDYELELIKKKTEWSEQEIRKRVGILVVTLGAEGSVLKHAQGEERISVFPAATVKDPTGAGDAYRAGLIAGYVAGLSIEQMGQLGACAASYALEHVGTQEHSYTLDEFRKRYSDHLDKECPL